MKRKLYKFQEEALRWAGDRNKVAFFMEMRLGKTIVSIRWTEQFRLQRILVVCPLAVALVWQEELFLEGCSSTLLLGNYKIKEQLVDDCDTRWFITNYESLYIQDKIKKVPSFIITSNWDCVILDESTYIRNPRALRTKMCRKLANIPYRAILTGLPNPESPMNYFEQLAFVHGDFLGYKNFWKFRHGCFHQGWTDWEWIPNSGTLCRIKEEVDKRAFILSRKKANIGSKKIYEKRYVELPKKVRNEYKKLESNFSLDDKETKWIVVVKVWLARLAGGQPEDANYCSIHKAEEIIGLLENELANDQCVIWFRFTLEILFMHHWLNIKHISNDFITGETDIHERQNVHKKFDQGKTRCLLIQLKCGKFGIDCSAASAAIYYSNSFAFEDRSQSEDRLISPKKKEPVLIIDILTKDTVDEDIYKALREKNINSKMFISRIIKNMKKRKENEDGEIKNEIRRNKGRNNYHLVERRS